MTTRTWAVWNKNRFFTYALPIFYFVIWAGGFVINAIFVQSLKCQHFTFHFPNLPSYFSYYSFQSNPILALHILDVTRHTLIPSYSFLGFSSSSTIQVRIVANHGNLVQFR